MKKIINNPEDVVDEMLEGFMYANKQTLSKIENVNGIIRKDIKDKVPVIIGGGSGHEPLFPGFVGEGLADGAAIGNVFTAPPPDTVQEVAKRLNSGKGILFVYGNYAGDVLNFDMATELLDMDGIDSKTVRVSDDVVSAPADRKEERRGIAGDVFVIKVAGAASEKGLPLNDIANAAQKAADRTFSVGVALSPGTIPDSGKPTFTLAEDEIEFGMGIHGEPGMERTQIVDADKMTEKLVDTIIDDSGIHAGDEVCVLVNGLGSTTLMELLIVNRRVSLLLKEKEIKVYDMDVNSYCTTQEMGGVSISFMRLDDELKRLYDAPANAPYYKKV